MGFFQQDGEAKDGDGRDGQDHARCEASMSRVERGGIPLAAEERLRALGADSSMFTSGLSVNEFALLGQLGPRPLAQVLGASVVRVGWQYLPALAPYVKRYVTGFEYPYEEPRFAQRRSYRWHETVVCELDAIAGAWSEVRRRALDRLSEEAAQVGADAVVGVHLQRGEHDWAKRTIDYLVSGTAIRLPGSKQEYLPLLSDLSVQDYWRLQSAGYEPAGLLATTAAVFVSASRSTRMQRARTLLANQELEELSRGFHLARDTVRERLRSQLRSCRGHLTVGVELSHTIHREEFRVERSVQRTVGSGWHRGAFGLPYYVSRAGETERNGWVITMHGAGTAIRQVREVSKYPPETVMRLGPK